MGPEVQDRRNSPGLQQAAQVHRVPVRLPHKDRASMGTPVLQEAHLVPVEVEVAGPHHFGPERGPVGPEVPVGPES